MTTFEQTTTRLRTQDMTACALIEDLLPLYIEGEVSSTTRDLMSEHLGHCERCAGFLAGAQSMRIQLRHDASARSSVIARDQSTQQPITNIQQLFRLIMVASVTVGGLLISGALWHDLGQRSRLLGVLLALL